MRQFFLDIVLPEKSLELFSCWLKLLGEQVRVGEKSIALFSVRTRREQDYTGHGL